MRALLAVFAVILLGGAAYWALLDNGSDVAPPSNDSELDGDGQNGNVDHERVDRDQVIEEPDTLAPPPPAEDPETQPDTPDPDAPDATVTLAVFDVVPRKPIDAFRWRFVQQSSQQRGESTDSVAELALPRRAVGDLLIEAAGMQAFTKKQITIPAENAPNLLLDVFLTPATTAAGITLMAKNLDNQPIPNVRVDAFQINDQNRETAWQLGQPLWARSTAAEDGVYALPTLPPGEYGILLVATSATGELLPLAPFRRIFVLNGSNGFLEDVPLEEACALRLELLETNGQPFDPKVHGNVTISLNPIGQTGLQRKWTTNRKPNASGEVTGTVSAANVVPGPGLIWLDEPTAAGSYLLEIFINGDPRVNQTLLLRGNEVQTEQIYVR